MPTSAGGDRGRPAHSQIGGELNQQRRDSNEVRDGIIPPQHRATDRPHPLPDDEFDLVQRDCPTLEKVSNCMPKCLDRSTEHVCNFLPKVLRTLRCLNYLGLRRHLGCAFYSTVLVLRQTIYCGRLLLVIALVIATGLSPVFINPNVKKRH